MMLTIGRGRGYVAADGNKGPETTIGMIPVDSIFSPVRRVSYDVDAARVGQRTDFDKLKLEVTTDGSMTPKDAVKDAAELLAVGESKADTACGAPTLAAWTMLTNELMNLDEVLNK